MTGGNGVSDLHTFLATHQLQLETAGVPRIYWDRLHTKLANQIFDAGEQFTLLQVQYRHYNVLNHTLLNLFARLRMMMKKI